MQQPEFLTQRQLRILNLSILDQDRTEGLFSKFATQMILIKILFSVLTFAIYNFSSKIKFEVEAPQDGTEGFQTDLIQSF